MFVTSLRGVPGVSPPSKLVRLWFSVKGPEVKCFSGSKASASGTSTKSDNHGLVTPLCR